LEKNATFTLSSFALLGFASLLVVSVTTSVILLGATIIGVWVHDTKYEPFSTPKAGDKITTKIEPATDGVKTTISYKAKNGGVLSGQGNYNKNIRKIITKST